MVSLAKYLSALTLIAAGSVLAVSGCAVDVEEPQPGDEQAGTAAPEVEGPGLEPQGPEFCCYADCADTPGKYWEYVGKPAYGQCTKMAKAYCAGYGTTMKGADWRPCP